MNMDVRLQRLGQFNPTEYLSIKQAQHRNRIRIIFYVLTGVPPLIIATVAPGIEETALTNTVSNNGCNGLYKSPSRLHCKLETPEYREM